MLAIGGSNNNSSSNNKKRKRVVEEETASSSKNRIVYNLITTINGDILAPISLVGMSKEKHHRCVCLTLDDDE
jgi:hypothetical protein